MRLPLGNSNEIALSPSPRASIPNRATISAAFRTSSALCLSDGLAARIKLFGLVYARCTAIAAAMVDFPHCRVQFKIPRFAPRFQHFPLPLIRLHPQPLAHKLNNPRLIRRPPLDRRARRRRVVIKKVHTRTTCTSPRRVSGTVRRRTPLTTIHLPLLPTRVTGAPSRCRQPFEHQRPNPCEDVQQGLPSAVPGTNPNQTRRGHRKNQLREILVFRKDRGATLRSITPQRRVCRIAQPRSATCAKSQPRSAERNRASAGGNWLSTGNFTRRAEPHGQTDARRTR